MTYFKNEMKNISFENESQIKKEAFANLYCKYPEYLGKLFFISYLLRNGDILIQLEGYNTNAVIDRKGNFKLGFTYLIHNCCLNGLYLCSNHHQQYGFINQGYEVVIPFMYDHADPFDKSGKARVRKSGRYFYINETGKDLGLPIFEKKARQMIDIFLNI